MIKYLNAIKSKNVQLDTYQEIPILHKKRIKYRQKWPK